MTETTFESLFDDYVTTGVPASGAKQPVKADIRATMQGRVGYAISGREVVKTADYTILYSDGGYTIIANKATAITFSLSAIATIAAAIEANTQFQCRVFNIGVGALTIDPDGSETINGAASVVLYQYESMTIWTDGTEWRGDKARRSPLTLADFGATGATDGSDTTAIQAALDFASTNGVAIDMGGTWYATSLTISGTAQGFDILGNAFIVGTASSATDAVVEITRGNFTISGAIKADAQRNTDYGCGIWVHNDTALQYVDLQKLGADGSEIGIRVGDAAHPDALMSEVTMSFVSTYSCPKAIQIEGTETYVTILGPQVSADDFGGDTAWQAIAKRAVTVIGASVTIVGGEVIQTTDTGTDNFIFDVQPLVNGDGDLVWGRAYSIGCLHETAGPLAQLHNPDTLSGTADDRKGVLSLVNSRGYVSQDSADFIQCDSDFDGEVRYSGLEFWAPSARSNDNISFANSAAIAIGDDNGFGVNFKGQIAGVSGGIVQFSRRVIFEGQGLPGATINSSRVLAWQTIGTTGDLARFSGAVSSGVFTVPAGGLKSVRVHAQAYVSGVTGSILIRNGGAEVARMPFDGNGAVEWVSSALSASDTIDAYIEVSSGSGTPNASGYLHRMTIEAAV